MFFVLRILNPGTSDCDNHDVGFDPIEMDEAFHRILHPISEMVYDPFAGPMLARPTPTPKPGEGVVRDHYDGKLIGGSAPDALPK